jgi:alpha-L-rhamnosidase
MKNFLVVLIPTRFYMGLLTGSVAIFIGLSGITSASAQVSAVTVDTLECQNLVNPLGIGETKPLLSWLDNSKRRGDKQTAYEVRVAGSVANLNKGQTDWDSGKVVSAENSVIFDQPLVSRQQCFWQVRVWDVDGRPSAWSPSASWEMGLLAPEDWKAKWINADRINLKNASNLPFAIVHASYEAIDGTAKKDVTDILKKKVTNGSLSVSVDSNSFGGDPAYMHVKVLKITYTLGDQQKTMTASEQSTVNLPGGADSLPYLRKTFSLSMPVKQARLYATALGLYELRLNGKRVGDHIFAPDWTDYAKRIRYQEYDVTSLLKQGPNAMGGLVGNGWYSGHLGNGGFQQYGKVPALFCQLEVTYANGTTDTIVSDETWKMYPSPILTSDFMMGENYDSTKEVKGWDMPSLKDDDWSPATTREEQRNLESQMDQPVREIQEMKPKSMSEPTPGHWTFDLGQNMVGVVRLKVTAPAGTTLTLRHGEMLSADHTLYTANLRGAPSIDTYVCHGGGVEIWQPRFTFHGFRYVELTGLPEKPTEDAVTGIVLGTATPRSGSFECSNDSINQLYSNICWGQRGNYLSIPTDCPQRDERLGWMGDAEVFVRTATDNADVSAFFAKWLQDVDDAQTSDGAFTDVSPNRGASFGTPGWADAGVICPWTIYQAYGDKRILEKNLPSMTKWIEWCRVHSTNLIRDKDRGGDYGDWLAIGADTPHDLIGTAFFAYSTHLVAKAYDVVGDAASAAKYQQLFEDIKKAFNDRYVKPDGHMTGDSQCDYAMALKFELLPEELRPQVIQLLADNIKAKGNHLSTGFLGVGYLLPMLTAGKKLDTAYSLLLQDTFPSWLFSVKQGATTIWERWDGWTPDRGFQDPGMNSFNHYSLGSCGQWLYQTVAGIDLDPKAVGYANVIIHPQPGGGLTSAKGSLRTAHGLVTTNWTVDGGNFTFDCTVPMNATATITLPSGKAQNITEGGKPLSLVRGLVPQKEDASPDETVLSAGSGTYHFVCPM